MGESRPGFQVSAPAWPPLVLPDRVPRWVRVRDLALTIAAWSLLAYWVRGALLLIWIAIKLVRQADVNPAREVVARNAEGPVPPLDVAAMDA